MIISGIINGKSKFLETTSSKHKTKPVTVRFVKEFDEIVGVDLEKYGAKRFRTYFTNYCSPF